MKLRYLLKHIEQKNIYTFFFLVALRPNAGHGLLILEVSTSHTATHHSRQGSSGRLISPSQRPLPDNTQHSQQTNIHAPGGIRNHDLSRRAAADLRLRPRGHWVRLFNGCFEDYFLFLIKWTFDVWLTVHRNSVWIRKTNQMSLFVFFISLLIVAQHVSGNRVPIIRS